MSDELQQRLDAINARTAANRDKHRQDVRYVQEHYPEVAEVLSEFVRAFGKGQVDYRVTLRTCQKN